MSVTLGVTAVLTTALAGCSAFQEEEYDYGAVCVDQQTQRRVDDNRCDDGGAFDWWYYMPVGSRAQPVGERASGGSFDPPPPGERAYLGGVPREGGIVERGGFGGNSDSVGG